MESINWQELLQMAGDANKPPVAGPHPVEVVSAEWKPTSTGKRMIKLRYRITGGPDSGKSIFDQLVLSPENPNALAMFFNNLAAFGVDPNMFVAHGEEAVVQALVGRQLTVTGKHREWKGQLQFDVQEYQPSLPGVGPVTPPVAAAAPVPAAPPVVAVPPPAAAPVTPPPVVAAPAPTEVVAPPAMPARPF